MVALRNISPTYRNTNPDVGGADVSVTLPTCVAGDLLVAFHSGRSPIPTGYGWTVVGTPYSGSGSAPDETARIGWRYAVAADSGKVETWNLDRDTAAVTVAAYSNPQPTNPFDVALTQGTGGSKPVTPSLTPSKTDDLLVVFFQSVFNVANPAVTPAGLTARRLPQDGQSAGEGNHHAILDRPTSTTDATGTYAAANANGLAGWAAGNGGAAAFLLVGQLPPTSPSLTYPVGAVNLDRATATRFSWVFADPNLPADQQSKAELRYRTVGSTTWTTVTVLGPSAFYDVAGGTFSAADYEWQVRTYDNLGTVSPWSSSEFFTASTRPAGPTITAPTNGATIATATGTLTWSTPSQTAYQVRQVADLSGSPDTTVVYYDSGQVNTTTARSANLSYPVNSRAEHEQLRTFDQGLWSPWSSVRVLVAYAAPATPSLQLTAQPSTASILVQLVNPTPSGGQPSVTGVDLYRRRAGGTSSIRIAKLLTSGTLYPDRTPASGREYEYQAVATGTTGTTAASAWTGTLNGTVAVDPGTGGSVAELDYADAEFTTGDYA